MNDYSINLYNELPKEYQHRIGLSKSINILIVLGMLMVAIWGYMEIKNNFSKDKLKTAITQKVDKQKTLQDLKKKYPKIAKSVSLQSALNQAQENLELHLDLSNELSKERFSNAEGFAIYFEALSRNIIPDLWMTEIKIQKGGSHMVFKGLTNDVSVVQKLLNELSNDQAFKSNVLKLKKIETSISSSGNDEFTLEAEPKRNKRIKTTINQKNT